MEVIDEFDEILKEFVDKNPWKGTNAERTQKFAEAHQQLANMLHLAVDFVPQVPNRVSEWEGSGRSFVSFTQMTDGSSKFTLHMVGRLSVMTFLYLWQMIATAASPSFEFDYIEVFNRYWPDKFANLSFKNGIYVKK